MGKALVVQGWGTSTHIHSQTPTDTHKYPLFPHKVSVAFGQQQTQQVLALPLQDVGGGSWWIPALWGDWG